ncbi:MAG: hypothetical protein IPH78_10840 [Bacteroidetes bacterium]|nr:hypothetical protein [Bacteroidota bacterium]
MGKVTTLFKATILFFGFAVLSNTASAQQEVSSASSRSQTAATKTTNVQNGKAELPYINYKGIADNDKAKAAWIKDNPEAYKKFVGAPVQPQKNTTTDSKKQ